MANPSVPAPEQHSLIGRLRREFRNPSMVTVILIILAFLAVPLIILVPSWISTTQDSLEARGRANAIRDASMVSETVLLPSQITPWLLLQIQNMETAASPAAWNAASFTEGPCDADNLKQLPEGQYSAAVADSCTSLLAIQQDYASDCRSIQVCNFPEAAKVPLSTVRQDLLDAFSDAGFVLPYATEEQQIGP